MKRPQTNCHCWGAESKSRYWAWALYAVPPRGRADHLSHTSCPTQEPPLLLPRLRNHLSPPPPQGHLLLVLAPSGCSMSPSKALPEFLVWPLISFWWLKSPRTWVGKFLLRPLSLSCRWAPSPCVFKWSFFCACASLVFLSVPKFPLHIRIPVRLD